MNWPEDLRTSCSMSSLEGQERRLVREGCLRLMSWKLDTKKVRISSFGRYLSSSTNRRTVSPMVDLSKTSRIFCSGRLAMRNENGRLYWLTAARMSRKTESWEWESPHSSKPSKMINFGRECTKSAPSLVFDLAISNGFTTMASNWASRDRDKRE